MLFVPAHAIALVPVAAEQRDGLATPRRLSVQPARLDQVAYSCGSGCLLGGHLTDLTRWPARSHPGQTRNQPWGIY